MGNPLGKYVAPDGTIHWVELACDAGGNSLVSSLRSAWRDDFNGSALNPANWAVISQGAGQTITLAGGELTIGAGTTAGEETIIRSVGTVSIPFRAWFIGRLSQRIANQEIRFELVNASGSDTAGWLMDGTTATNGKQYSSNGGMLGVSGASTVTSTAGDTCFELEMFPDEFWAIQRNVDSVSGRSNNYCRTRNIPDPNDTYYLQIRVTNLGAAPASNTQLILGAVAVQDINEITAEITGGRGDTTAAKAIAVIPLGGFYLNPGTGAGPITHTQCVSAATTNVTLVSALSGTNIQTIIVGNSAATWRYLKMFNKASAPIPGTDTPVLIVPLPPESVQTISPAAGVRFSAGFGFAITANPAALDATAIGAGEVVVNIVRP